MSKSQIVLIALIAGVGWVSKDYLATKKDLVVSQVDEIRASQSQEASKKQPAPSQPGSAPALQEFQN